MLFRFEFDRQLRAAGHERPVRRGVWPVVSRTGCCDSHSGLIQRRVARRADDRRILFESPGFIDADTHSHAVSLATGVTLSRIGRYRRRRSRDGFGCTTCRRRRVLGGHRSRLIRIALTGPPEANLLPRIDRNRFAGLGCGSETKPGDATDRRRIQRVRTRRRLDGDLCRSATPSEPENNHRYGSLISDPQIRTPRLGIDSQRRLRPWRIVGNGRGLSRADVCSNAQNHARESYAKPVMHQDRQCSGTAGEPPSHCAQRACIVISGPYSAI
jgi:hypothetical protein